MSQCSCTEASDELDKVQRSTLGKRCFPLCRHNYRKWTARLRICHVYFNFPLWLSDVWGWRSYWPTFRMNSAGMVKFGKRLWRQTIRAFWKTFLISFLLLEKVSLSFWEFKNQSSLQGQSFHLSHSQRCSCWSSSDHQACPTNLLQYSIMFTT